jgi:ABC-type dipeptide/oligopeptide/nickel transport system permease component/outer membrane protein assembly factor BamB
VERRGTPPVPRWFPVPRVLAHRRALFLLLVVVAALAAGASTNWGPAHPPGGTLPTTGAPLPAPSLLPGDSATPGWTTFHGAEDRSGYVASNGPASPTTLWAISAVPGPIRTSPVLSGDRGYVADTLGHVVAVNLTNGALVWSVRIPAGPTTADLSGNLLVFGTSGGVTVLNAGNGSLAWNRSTTGAVVQGVAITGSLVVVGTSSGSVRAFDRVTGASVWSDALGAAVTGAPAVAGGFLWVVSSNATASNLTALYPNGTVAFVDHVTAPVQSGPAASGGSLVLADMAGNVSAFAIANGSPLWKFHDPHPGDRFQTTALLTPTTVVVSSAQGTVFAIDLSSGQGLWNTSFPTSGFPVTSSPAGTPSGVYLVDASENVTDLDPSGGVVLWRAPVGALASESSPAIDRGALVVGNEVGQLLAIGTLTAPRSYPVRGVVLNSSGFPIVGAVVDARIAVTSTGAAGTFTLVLPNGTYVLNVSAPGYLPVDRVVTVAGPVAPITVVLPSPYLTVLPGILRDSHTFRGIPDAKVTIYGANGYLRTAKTLPDGSFTIAAPNGTDYLTVDPPAGYQGLQVHVDLPWTNSTPIALALDPVGGGLPTGGPLWIDVWVPYIAATMGIAAAGIGARYRARIAQGLRPTFLSAFEKFVAMRLLLIIPQVVAILVILYLFGTFLPAAAQNVDPCSLATSACSGCTWSNLSCVVTIFWGGFETFLVNMFTGNWGFATFGHLVEPAAQLLSWWAPNSIELAFVALLIAGAIGYPLGLWAGWRRESATDLATRVTSLIALLVPSFIFVFLVLGIVYNPFYGATGDTPYGFFPSQVWYINHGTEQPYWLGPGSNTSPTGFPLIDSALHGDWTFWSLVAFKTVLQASIIAVVFLAIFLRFARNAVAEAAAEPHVNAARARGIPERRLLWYHTGRRVLPLYLLIFGLTIPIYIGTQALVEAIFSDPGVGTLLLAGMTQVSQTGFGFGGTAGGVQPGNFYQVSIFLLLFIVLLGSLLADIVARFTDPRISARDAP